MKKLIVLLLLVSSLFSDTTTNMSTSVGCQQILQMDNKKLIVKSGCCSWHGGVCDCGSNGRVICCDGTYSPSCTCKEEKSLIKESDGNKG